MRVPRASRRRCANRGEKDGLRRPAAAWGSKLPVVGVAAESILEDADGTLANVNIGHVLPPVKKTLAREAAESSASSEPRAASIPQAPSERNVRSDELENAEWKHSQAALVRGPMLLLRDAKYLYLPPTKPVRIPARESRRATLGQPILCATPTPGKSILTTVSKFLFLSFLVCIKPLT